MPCMQKCIIRGLSLLRTVVRCPIRCNLSILVAQCGWYTRLNECTADVVTPVWISMNGGEASNIQTLPSQQSARPTLPMRSFQSNCRRQRFVPNTPAANPLNLPDHAHTMIVESSHCPPSARCRTRSICAYNSIRIRIVANWRKN